MVFILRHMPKKIIGVNNKSYWTFVDLEKCSTKRGFLLEFEEKGVRENGMTSEINV